MGHGLKIRSLPDPRLDYRLYQCLYLGPGQVLTGRAGCYLDTPQSARRGQHRSEPSQSAVGFKNEVDQAFVVLFGRRYLEIVHRPYPKKGRTNDDLDEQLDDPSFHTQTPPVFTYPFDRVACFAEESFNV
jgi:hypothetical protein